MADLQYQPLPHNHAEFLATARQRPGFNDTYDSLQLEYTVTAQMLKARTQAGLTQDAVAERMGTTVVSPLGGLPQMDNTYAFAYDKSIFRSTPCRFLPPAKHAPIFTA